MIAFSQSDTLKIPKRSAIGAVKDILKKDILQVEVNTLNKNISIYQDNLKLKDSIIVSKTSEINLFKIKDTMSQRIIDLGSEQQTNLNKSINELKVELKEEKRKVTITTIGGIILAFLVYVIAK